VIARRIPKQANPRSASFALLLVGLAVLLSACSGSWFTPEEEAGLIVRAPILVGETWEVVISVANIPHGGLAGIHIDQGGITTENVDESTMTASGMNGFVVTAQDYTDPEPKGTLIAVNPSEAITGGKILKFTFQATGESPVVTLDKSKVTLSTDLGTFVTSWELSATGNTQ
jgi:hypothetical protein